MTPELEASLKVAIRSLIYKSQVNPDAVATIVSELNKEELTNQDWEILLNKEGADIAIEKQIYSPHLIRLLTLRALLIPETLPEFLKWLKISKSKKLDTKQIVFLEFQKGISPLFPKIQASKGITYLLTKLVSNNLSVDEVSWLLLNSEYQTSWGDAKKEVINDIKEDLKLFEDYYTSFSKEDLDSLSTVGLNPLKDPIENLVDVNITATQKLQDIYKQIVILSNDFKLLNATELAAAAQAEFAKKSTAVEAASMMENTAKMKAVASAMAVGEVGASSGFGGIGDWFNGLNLGYSGGLSGANIPSASSGIGGMVDTADLKKINTGEQKFSTFKDIKNDKEKVVQLVNEYFRQYTAVKEYGKMENQQVFFEGKGGSIDLTLNGEVFKTFQLSKDKDFQEAFKRQLNQTIQATNQNGGKNTSPNPPY